MKDQCVGGGSAKERLLYITYLSTGSVAAVSAWPWHLKHREGLFYCTDTTTMDKRC